MLDNMIREMSARWGLADQGRPLVQMLLAHIQNPATGGLSGFLDQFRKAGWGSMVSSWMGNQTAVEMPTAAQIETVLGSDGSFLSQAANRLGLSADKVTAAVAGILPTLVARMTPDGHIPTVLPPEFASLAREGQSLLGIGAGAGAGAAAYGATRAGAHTTSAAVAQSASSSGFGKWLPWLIAALAVLLGLTYCSRSKDPVAEAPAASTAADAPATVPAQPITPPASTVEPIAPAPITTESVPAAAAPDTSAPVVAHTENFTVPDGADVIDDMVNGMPVLRVFFDTGKTDVAAAFANKSQSLVSFLQANPDVTAVISGFNDPTGDPVRNAELSKQRAEAVKAALESAGVPADRAVLEKPAETTDTGASNAASRRVDVMLRR